MKNNATAIINILSSTEQISDVNMLKEYVDIAKKLGHHMLFILRDILDYNRIINNKFKIQTKEYSIKETIGYVLSIAQFIQPKDKDIAFRSIINVPESE